MSKESKKAAKKPSRRSEEPNSPVHLPTAQIQKKEKLEELLTELGNESGYKGLVSKCRNEMSKIAQMYWAIGNHINLFLEKKKGRKDKYGAKIHVKLARDTGLHQTTIYQCIKFASVTTEEEMKEFTSLPWRKTRVLTPFLEHEEAKQNIIEDVDSIKEMNDWEFKDYLNSLSIKFLEKEHKGRGRPPGEQTNIQYSWGRHVQAIKNVAIQGKLSPLVEDFKDEDGFFAALSWKEGEDKEKIISVLEELLTRLKKK